MEKDPRNTEETRNSALPGLGDRVVYVLPDDWARANDDDIDLKAVWEILWQGKWITLTVTSITVVLSIIYALSLTHWYRSEVLLAPTEERTTSQSLAGQLGGIAGLVGIGISAGSNVEALAVLRSRDFTRAFIEDQNLLPVLFADRWNGAEGRWMDEDPNEWPDLRNAVQFFSEDVRTIDEDEQTGLVTLAIEWPDPELAAEWAALLVQRLNEYMRSRALSEAERNVKYLQAELGGTSVVALQQSIGRLLEVELQKLMLARGNEEFAFRIIDRPQVPNSPSRPSRRLIVIAAALAGGLLSVLLVLVRHVLMSRLSSHATVP